MIPTMKRILLASLLALFAAAPARALVSTNITDGWLKQPVSTKGVADKSEAIAPKEEPEAWTEGGKLAGKPDRAPGEPGSCRYYVSDAVEGFSAPAERFLGGDLDGTVEQVEIGMY